MVEYVCDSCQNQICIDRCSRRAVVIPSKYIGRPQSEQEPDLLTGNEQSILKVGESVYQPPQHGWTHDLIERYVNAYDKRHLNGDAWDVYLGSHWCGSSEI
ncbi:hypothetical protein [Vibrio agarivorans]|uniref:hypothetical protein n=1 Tax=Vibrio agarivorans TaxID=153622 RepID=UPI0025B5A275|nr:hypothetical protein [Vibrio agarivorans]MDN3661114.1 hypothetical protein [Vibrio agarivorans]